jgi:O-antigen/teichoic acid export membrane protein
MTVKKRLIGASAMSLVDYVVKISVVLVVSPYLIKTLGKEDYGSWVLLLSVLGYLELLDMGMNHTGLRYLSRAVGGGGVGEVGRIFMHFRTIYRRTGLISLVATLAMVGLVPYFVEQPEKAREAQIVLGLGGVATSLSFPLRIHFLILKSHLLYSKVILAGFGRLAVFTGLMLWVLQAGGGLPLLCVAWVCGLAVELFMVWNSARNLSTHEEESGPVIESERKEINGYAAKMFGWMAAGFLREKLDTQVLAANLPIVSVTNYSVGMRLINMLVDIVNAIFGSQFLAAISRVQARDGTVAAGQRLLSTLKVSGPLALSAGGLVFVFGCPFIDCWLGTGFEDSHAVIRLLALPFGLVLMQYPVGPYLGSMNRHGMMIVVSLVGGLLNLTGSLILVRLIGFEGVVIATAVELTITALLFRPWMLLRLGSVSPKGFLWVLLRPVTVLLPLIFLLDWLLRSSLATPDWLRLAVSMVGAGGFLLAAIWWGILSSEDRQGIVQAVKVSRSPAR